MCAAAADQAARATPHRHGIVRQVWGIQHQIRVALTLQLSSIARKTVVATPIRLVMAGATEAARKSLLAGRRAAVGFLGTSRGAWSHVTRCGRLPRVLVQSVTHVRRAEVRHVLGWATVLARVVPSRRVVPKWGSPSLAPLGHFLQSRNRRCRVVLLHLIHSAPRR